MVLALVYELLYVVHIKVLHWFTHFWICGWVSWLVSFCRSWRRVWRFMYHTVLKFETVHKTMNTLHTCSHVFCDIIYRFKKKNYIMYDIIYGDILIYIFYFYIQYAVCIWSMYCFVYTSHWYTAVKCFSVSQLQLGDYLARARWWSLMVWDETLWLPHAVCIWLTLRHNFSVNFRFGKHYLTSCRQRARAHEKGQKLLKK